MIPTMIVVGLVLGRWWKTTLVLAALGWPVILVTGGTVPAVGPWSWADVGVLCGAGLLAAANAGVGVAVHQAILRLVRGVRHAFSRSSWFVNAQRGVR